MASADVSAGSGSTVEEDLRVENARLVAEMASMKKKIMVAFKKQQAELQNKLQAAEKLRGEAEQRAAAAEAAVAAAAETNGDVPSGQFTVSELTKKLEKLEASLAAARHSKQYLVEDHTSRHEETLKRALRAEEALLQVEKELDRLQRAKQSEGDAHQTIQGLENQLISAATQVADAFARAAETEEENNRLQRRIIASSEKTKLTEKDIKAVNEKLETLQCSQMEHAKGQEEAASKIKAAEDNARRLAEELANSQAEIARLHAQKYEAEEGSSERLQREQEAGQQRAVDEVISLQRQLEEHISRCRSVEVENADLQERLSKAEQLAEVTMARLTQIEQSEAKLQERKLAVDGAHEVHAEEISQLQAEVIQLRANLATAEKAVMKSEDQLGQEGTSIAGINNDLQEELTILKRKAEGVEDLRVSLATALSKASFADSLQLEVLRLQGEIDSKGEISHVVEEAGMHGKDEASALQTELRQAEQRICEQAAELARLEGEIQTCRACQSAAEESASRVATAAAATEQKLQELGTQLREVRTKGEEELKSRDEMFGRLQKHAKKRIQEVTKEKEDAEVQVVAAGERTAQALSQQAALEEELGRIRQHSNEAISAAESEKEKLRSSNASLVEEIEDLRRVLEVKEITLNESRRLAAAKEQSLLEISCAAQEEKEQRALAVQELTERIQKITENYETRLKEAQADLGQSNHSLNELKAHLAVKEQQLAELETATSGEIARLMANLEEARGETLRLEEQQRGEIEGWEVNMHKLKKKLDATERARKMGESSAAEAKSKLESDLEALRQTLSSTQNRFAATREEADRLSLELAAYKVRAAALLQKKNAELEAAKDVEYAAAQAAAIQAAKLEAKNAISERDNAVRELDMALIKHERELAARAGMLMEAQQRVRELATRQETVRGQMDAQQVECHAKLKEVEAAWNAKYTALEGRVNKSVEAHLNNQLAALHSENQNKQAEYDSWKDMANQMLEEKEAEIRRLLNETANLQSSLSSLRQHVSSFPHDSAAAIAGGFLMPEMPSEKPETAAAATAAEQQILLLARQQAQREEEVAQCRRHIQALQDELADIERENRLHAQQEALLKDELRNMERSQNRQGVDMTYLKNVILKLLQTGEATALLPVIAMLLQFSPEELKKCNEVYQNVPP